MTASSTSVTRPHVFRCERCGFGTKVDEGLMPALPALFEAFEALHRTARPECGAEHDEFVGRERT